MISANSAWKDDSGDEAPHERDDSDADSIEDLTDDVGTVQVLRYAQSCARAAPHAGTAPLSGRSRA